MSLPATQPSSLGPALLVTGDSKSHLSDPNDYRSILAETKPGWSPDPLLASIWGYMVTPDLGGDGFTTQAAHDQIDSYISTNATKYATPAAVLYDLGVNDGSAGDATWQSNTLYVFDAIHTRWPTTKIYMAKIWCRGCSLSQFNTGWAAVIAARPAFVFAGIDETVVLEGGDNGVTNTSDGTHPNAAGAQAMAAAWKTVLGY